MTDVGIDQTFHYKVKRSDEDTPEYKEYRRKWVENPRNFVVGDFPIHLDIETNTGCNLKCYMCFQSFDPPKRETMDLEFAKSLIDEGARKGLCSIKTQYRGEPLLYRGMPELIGHAKRNGIIEAMFNTNATLLDEKMANALIEAGMDKIICSIDGYEKEVYENVRIGGIFEEVLANVERIQALKKERDLVKPYIRVQMVDTPRNHHQIDGYIDFWSKRVEDVAVEQMLDWMGEEEDDTPIEWACAQLWQRMIVTANGQVLPCCRGINGVSKNAMIIGDAHEQSLEDIWKSDILTKLRELHTTGRSHEMEICRSCGLRKNAIHLARKNGQIP